MSSNTSAKRLTESDAKAIFASLANNKQPPEGLEFKIIRVPQNGLKLSPPSLEFGDGLYALLRSPANKLARVPSELSDKLLTESDLACMQSCSWSLSGPQYPRHKKIQQRYCYPRGNPGYSQGKGGAIWTKVNSDGKEDIDCRILHVYHSNKRAGTVAKTTKTASPTKRQPKRKSSEGEEENNKKNKTSLELCPSLLKGDLLRSPSYELDSSLDFNSDNLFAASFDTDDRLDKASFDQSFSFMPVQSKDIDDMVKNNPAFNSAARPTLAPATNGYYYGQYLPYAYAYGGRHSYYGDWLRAAPSIPQLTTSEQKAKDGNGRSILALRDFSKRLQDMEESTMADIRDSASADQARKMHLLLNWAKAIAQKPLQLQKAPTLAPTESNTSATQVKIKMESPGTPSITP